ncbi:MAG: BamA/TamA family outer membrane protein [Bacteroidetes bacterium]|nr:BamA/TamA family outer membrane protein [Bacteroidota bacterium]
MLLCTAVLTAQPAQDRVEVTDIDITINGVTAEQEVVNQMATLESPWGIWVMLNENIYEKIGAPRAYFNQVLFQQDVISIREFFRDRGYFKVRVDTVLTYSADRREVQIALTIDENEQSVIDTVRIIGLDAVPEIVAQEVFQRPLLRSGDPFNKNTVVAEQSRILRTLTNAGYAEAFLDSVGQVRYASTNNISITLRFVTGTRFVFGDVQFDHQDAAIDSSVLVRQLDFEQGEMYNDEKRITSEQNLNRLGVFEFASIRKLPPVRSHAQEAIPLMISFRMLELQEITPELLVLNENNSLFSTGFGLSYKHRNLFGGAQNFSISSRARANKIEDLDFPGAFNSGLAEPTLFGKADIESQLVFPYFFSNKTSAAISLTAEAEKQEDYDLNTLRGRIAFSSKVATFTIGVTEFNVERVDPFYKTEKTTGIRPDDSTKQFNVIESFTLQRDKTNNFFSPTAGFFHSITVEEAGLVSRTAGGFGLPYSEYVKVSFLAKHYLSGSNAQRHVLAFKVKAGIAQLYNETANPTPVPLPRRFLVGGSGSVRGWKDKQLASFSDALQGGNIAFEGSIESRLQLFPNGGNLNVLELARFWSVLFLDLGNTWESAEDVMVRETAMAVGFGLRYETFVGPFRFDVAWRLYDPKKPQGEQWLQEQRFFHDSFSIVHFGIGHAF